MQRHDALSPAGIAEQNGYLLRQYLAFRLAADAIVSVWREHPEVTGVALIGSVAVAPRKEVPRFAPYRRKKVVLWHECKDLDVAIWLSHLRELNALRRAKARALRDLYEATQVGVASHQVDVFVLEPGTDRYLGRLCDFNRCPKGKPDCWVSGCGDVAFLKQHEGFQWRPDSLTKDRAIPLFDRAAGTMILAADLPLPNAGNDAFK